MLNMPRSASVRALSPTALTGCSVQQFRAMHPSSRTAEVAEAADADI